MRREGKKFAWGLNRYDLLLTGFIVLIFVMMCMIKPNLFPKWDNINSMFLQLAEIGLLSVGMALAFLIGGIDLSIVSNAVLSATLAGYVMLAFKDSAPFVSITAGICTAVLTGTVCGAVNGALISKVNIPPILATLGTNSLYRGIAVGITGGTTLGGFIEEFAVIGNGHIFGVYYAFIIFLIIIIGVGLFLGRTRGGVLTALLGRNEKAAYFSGIHNTKLTIAVYAAIGSIAGAAGIIMMSRSNSINPDYGVSYLLQAILICVVADVDIKGGRVRMSGLFLALLLMQIISTSFNMLMTGYSGATFFKNIVWGLLLLILIIIKYYSANRRRSVKSKGVNKA